MKGVVVCDFNFFNISLCLMLLFEHKQYLQSYEAESSMQTEMTSFKIVSLMPTKTAHRDLQ